MHRYGAPSEGSTFEFMLGTATVPENQEKCSRAAIRVQHLAPRAARAALPVPIASCVESCTNSPSITGEMLDELRERMAPEIAAEAMCSYAEETVPRWKIRTLSRFS